MKLIFIHILPILLTLYFIEQYASDKISKMTFNWIKHDISLNSNIVAYSLSQIVNKGTNQNHIDQINEILSHGKLTDRVLDFAICKDSHHLSIRSKNFPAQIQCGQYSDDQTIILNKKEYYIYTHDIFDDSKKYQGHIIFVYNLSSFDWRMSFINKAISSFVAICGLAIVFITIASYYLNSFLTLRFKANKDSF